MKKTPVLYNEQGKYVPGFQFVHSGFHGLGKADLQLFKIGTSLGGHITWCPAELDTEEAQVAYAKWKLSQ